MSRIGKQPVEIPAGVEVKIEGSTVSVKSKKGDLSQTFNSGMSIEVNGNILEVKRASESREHRELHGLTRSLINNMVTGLSEGFTKKLRVEGVGYRAEMSGSTLVLQVGYSHPVEFVPDEGMSFAVEDRGKTIIVHGIDKQLVGEISARIRKTRPPEPYKGKGIRYDGEVIRRKAGKAGKV
ncbi:MAG TPA: 50S ribosomal protein L6 [Anaerolineae bacterium]|nr:50S ribosomal protein L6 [Anaerolineae bacterium]